MSTCIRSLLVAATVAVAVAAGVEPARAQVQPTELATSDVVVEPAAPLAEADRDRLMAAARELRDAGTPTKFVVVANRPLNPPQAASDLRRSLGFNGNVLLLSLSPRSLGIGSGLSTARVQGAFDRSVSELRADPVGGTIAVARRLGTASGPPAGSGSPPSRSPGSGLPGVGGFLLMPLVFFFLVPLLGFFFLRSFFRPRRRREPVVDITDERAGLEPLVDALAAQVGELDNDIRFGAERAKDARPHYDEAVLAYGDVRETMSGEMSPATLDSARHTLERGLRAAQAARAVLDGRPPPPEETSLIQGMCTFDPKHGRAVKKMRIVTPAGDEATLPVCRSCSEGLEQGTVPEVRRVSRHGEEVPYWEGAGTFGFGGGLMPMFGGMLGGMMLHDLLTPDVTVIDDGDFGAADFGGGFGGGDFGGGGFGGGGDF